MAIPRWSRHIAIAHRTRRGVFDTLVGLVAGENRAVLDLGCGTGFLARPLASLVDRVDAVDVSEAMIDEGKRLPGGDNPRLNWFVGRAEDVQLQPPYALATAGASLHWMDWDLVLPRLAGVLSPSGPLAIVDVDGKIASDDPALQDGIIQLIRRYSTFDQWRPDFDLVAELTRRGLFREQGRMETEAMQFRQPVDAYMESFHARASLSWQRMAPDAAAAFDAALRDLMLSRAGEVAELAVRATIAWGRPSRP